MSKRKGLSLDEKRSKMLELFYEKKSFFQLKEIEKMAPKEKGITLMSVKEVVQSLVDDGLVDSDKIGTSIYFWAFPSKAMQIRKNKINQLQNSINQLQLDIDKVSKSITLSIEGKQVTDEREKLVEKYDQLTEQLNQLNEQLNVYGDCSPDFITHLKNNINILTDATNRWTENIFNIVNYCKIKLNLEEKELYKYFGIPEEFDFI